jgi:hypothetical protein
MITSFEKWVFCSMGSLIAIMCVVGVMAGKSTKECRMELAKSGRSAEDIVKICP